MEETGWPRAERIQFAQVALVAALVAVAALGWLLTDERMAGMDMGPGTDPLKGHWLRATLHPNRRPGGGAGVASGRATETPLGAALHPDLPCSG